MARGRGLSGSNGLDSRDGLPDAVAEVHDGRAGGLVIYRLDRLARDLILQAPKIRMKRLTGWSPVAAATGR